MRCRPYHRGMRHAAELVCVCVCVFFSCIGERVKKCSNVFGDISLGVREELVLFSGLIANGLRLDAACIYRC